MAIDKSLMSLLTFYLFSNRIDIDILNQIFSEITWVIEPRFETKIFKAEERKCMQMDLYRKAFSKFYHRHSELIVKYNIGLKTLLQRGISEPIFYGDLVYKFKRIVGKPNFSDQFKKIVKRYIRVGYNLDIMRQSACLVVNPITVYSYGFLFNCTTVGRASDSMTALT